MKRVEKVNDLWDFAVSHPDGFTWDDARKEFPWAVHRASFFAVVRALRTTLGAADTINLVCEPQGSGELWLYKLVGTYDDGKTWTGNRLGDLETRLETVAGVSKSLTAATDGRSIAGRKARLIDKTVGRLIEDLQEIVHGPPLF